MATQIDAATVLEVLSERRTPVKFELEEICFKEQLAFIRDPSPWVTASCSRRSGKTEVCALDLINTAVTNPNTTSLYITMTRANAERIVWSKLLAINEKYQLGGEVNLSKLSLTFPNKSVIYLSGCNDKSELDKFRGLALKLVYIDEVQSFKSFIQELVDQVLAPALADYAGSIKFLGTPAPLNSGFFWDILNSPDYSHHSWTFFQNPFIAQKSGLTHQQLLDRELKRRGVPVTHPSIRREWYGEWKNDEESLVFAYNKNINHYEELPELTDFVLGVDVGYNDSDAIAVIGWHKHKPEAYLVEELVKAKQGVTELCQQIQFLVDKYAPIKIVMDTGGGGKKLAEEFRKRNNLPIEPAQKTQKISHIEILNDALRTRRFFAKSTSRFAQDCNIVEWDYDKSTPDKRVVKAEPHSDSCDATLYGFREALHWLVTPAATSINMSNREQWLRHTQQLMEENLEKQIRNQQSEDSINDQFAMLDQGLEDNPLQYFLNKRNQ